MTHWLKSAYFGGLILLIFFILILSFFGCDICVGQYQAIHAAEVKSDEILLFRNYPWIGWFACSVLYIGLATLIPLFIGVAKDIKYLLIPAMACFTVYTIIEWIFLIYMARYYSDFYPMTVQTIQANLGLVGLTYIIITYFNMDIWTGD